MQKSLEEMDLEWKLDPKLLGEREKGNRGKAAIVRLLSRLTVTEDENEKTVDQSQLSGALQDNERGGGADGGAGQASTSTKTASKPVHQYERHDLLRAIERQDHETILNIRNANFDLLIEVAPGAMTSSSGSSSLSQTPLGYAIALGPKFEGTQIVLTGALSKFVNSLPDPDDQAEITDVLDHSSSSGDRPRRRPQRVEYDPRTMNRLRKVKGSLKLAVDHSLATDQTRLLASYVQVSIMTEGSHFIQSTVSLLQSSIRSLIGSSAPAHGQVISSNDPLGEAQQAVLQFVSQSLRKRERVAAVQDLIDNATGDLVLMGLWELIKLTNAESQEYEAMVKSGGELPPGLSLDDLTLLTQSLPPYYFARDDRITSTFTSRVESLRRLLPSSTISSQKQQGQKRKDGEWKRAKEVGQRLSGHSGVRVRLESQERVEVLRQVLYRS